MVKGGGLVEDEKGGGLHLMRLLGFNQYGIWPEDDWKTNLIWEAIHLSFISQALSLSLSGGSAWLLLTLYSIQYTSERMLGSCK